MSLHDTQIQCIGARAHTNMHYEALRELAYQTIDEICRIPQYDDCDDDFDEDEPVEKDSNQHAS